VFPHSHRGIPHPAGQFACLEQHAGGWDGHYVCGRCQSLFDDVVYILIVILGCKGNETIL